MYIGVEENPMSFNLVSSPCRLHFLKIFKCYCNIYSCLNLHNKTQGHNRIDKTVCKAYVELAQSWKTDKARTIGSKTNIFVRGVYR